jgi:hypothetical protein
VIPGGHIAGLRGDMAKAVEKSGMFCWHGIRLMIIINR